MRKLAGMEWGMVAHMLVCMAERKVEDMLVCMAARKVEDKVCMVAHIEEDSMVVHLGEDSMVVHIEEDSMVADIPFGHTWVGCSMVEDNFVCKALDIQSRTFADIRVGMVRKLVGKARNNHCYNGYSLSKEVLKHPKKATRLRFPVVFSLKTPCLRSCFVRRFLV